MTSRIQFAVGLALATIILPIIVVQAQSEGEAQAPAPEDLTTVGQATAETTAQEDAAPVEGEVLGESDVAVEPESGATTEPATTTESVASDIGTSTEAASSSDESATGGIGTASEGTTEPDETDIDVETASSTDETATSTPRVEEPKPIEEPYVLQPAVTLHMNGSSVSADIELQNLTCKLCEKVLPELDVIAYYTAWYPNDGPVEGYNEAKTHLGEQQIKVSDLANWSSTGMSWSAEAIAPGHYYFVVEVDPENANGAYRLFRSEFAI